MLLLYEFPDRYTGAADALTGAVDGVTWLTADEVGPEGEPVPSGAALHVRGWAPNLDVTGPATQVVLSVDGVHKHHARVGGLRPDVARHFDNDNLGASGFEAIVTTGRLAPGEHEIVAYSVDAKSRRYARLAQSLTFTIVVDWKSLPPDVVRRDTLCAGNLDEVVDESRGRTLEPIDGTVAVPRGSLLTLRGWLSNRSPAAPFEAAYALVDGERAYPLEYGSPRPDVSGALEGAESTDVGFRVSIPTVTLKRGMHRIEIVGMDGDTVVPSPITLEIIVGQSSSARFALHQMTSAFLEDVVRIRTGTAPELGGPLRVMRGDRLFVRGWAIDDVARDVAAGVVFVIDGRIEVPALYGLPRPDVAEVHQNDALVRSGFSGEIETDDLPAGLHRAECRVLARDGRGAFSTAQRFDFEVSEN
jgi:hypothetical protein